MIGFQHPDAVCDESGRSDAVLDESAEPREINNFLGQADVPFRASSSLSSPQLEPSLLFLSSSHSDNFTGREYYRVLVVKRDLTLTITVRLCCVRVYYSGESLKYADDGEGKMASNKGGKTLYNVSPPPNYLRQLCFYLPGSIVLHEVIQLV